GLHRGDPFNPIEEFKREYRCIASDLRNANDGHSSGPLEIDRPWDAYTDDQLGLMDYLRIDRFMVMGFCIGGPFIWNLLKRAPDHTSELQSRFDLVCRLLLEKKKKHIIIVSKLPRNN